MGFSSRRTYQNSSDSCRIRLTPMIGWLQDQLIFFSWDEALVRIFSLRMANLKPDFLGN